MPFPHVAFRPIAGNSDVLPFSGVWLLRNSNQALRRFISLARTLSKTWNRAEQIRRGPANNASLEWKIQQLKGIMLQFIDVGDLFADHALVLGTLCLGEGPIARHEARDHRRDELCRFDRGLAGFLGEQLRHKGQDRGGRRREDRWRSSPVCRPARRRVSVWS